MKSSLTYLALLGILSLGVPNCQRAHAAEAYDDEGNRVTLKVGGNHVECQPTDEEGFTRCGPVSQRARRDLQAKLSAKGMETEELQMALQRAEDAGDIPPRQFGALSYRRFDTADRIQYLFVVSLPNATAEQLGMPTGSQRDNSLAGQGTPWMMRSGTSGAHLMIPDNGITPIPEDSAGMGPRRCSAQKAR